MSVNWLLILLFFCHCKGFAQQDSCQKMQTFFQDGKVESEGCVKNNKKEGTWKEYAKASDKHFVRFVWEYKNGLKDGKYHVYGQSGILEAEGYYKHGALIDTLKSYNDKGELTKYEVFKPIDGVNGGSISVFKQILIKPEHPDNYIELVDGRTFIWIDGRRYETKKSIEQNGVKKKISIALDIPWEGFGHSSVKTKEKITLDFIQGKWSSIRGIYKEDTSNYPISLKTPVLIEFKKNTVSRSSSRFLKYSLKNNIISIKNNGQEELGIINKITTNELVITWKIKDSYTRYYYTR